MPWIFIMFCILLVTVIVAWYKSRKVGLILFYIFLAGMCLLLLHHMTDPLAIQL